MLAAERRVYIMECLSKKSIVSLKEIAAELDISEITVRRDFEKLESAGKLKRVPGGAALEDYLDSVELTMTEKSTINLDAKHEVAKRAAQLVKEGDCVFLDGGTSVAPMIEYLANMNVTVVTYNELALRKLVNPVATIHVIGGIFLPHYVMNVGPEAQEAIRKYHFDIAFFGCTGIVLESNMSYITNMDSLRMKQIAMGNSNQKVLLADASKFDKPSFLKFSDLDAFDHIFCDRPKNEIEDSRFEFV